MQALRVGIVSVAACALACAGMGDERDAEVAKGTQPAEASLAAPKAPDAWDVAPVSGEASSASGTVASSELSAKSASTGPSTPGASAVESGAANGSVAAQEPGEGGEGAKKITQAELEKLTDEIRAQVEELRGLNFERPVKVSVATKEEFLKYARERMEKSTTDAKLAAEECVAKLLGLVPVGMDLQQKVMRVLETQVGGFYDPATDSFCLMESFGGGVAKVILAHELTHALDDQHFDLDGAMEERKDDADRLFAYQAVVEGSGTALMGQWTMKHLGEIDPKELGALQDLGAEELKDAPEYIWKPLIGAYMRGSAFLARTTNMIKAQMKPLAIEDLNRAFEEPPRSSEQVLHPDKYWDAPDEPRDVKVVVAEADGWKRLGGDVLGEIGWGLVMTPPEKRKGLDASNPMALLSLKFGLDATAGWGGDRWALMGKGKARYLLAATVWDSAADAAEFEIALREVLPHVEAAAAEMGGGGESDASIERTAEDRVDLRVWSGLASGEREALERALKVEVAAPAPPAPAGG